MALTLPIKQLLKAKERSLFILAAAIFALPTGNENFINPLLMLVLINTIFSVKGSDWLSALKNPVFYLPALFYAYYASTVFWADDKTDAGPQLETKLTFFAATLVIAANARHLALGKQLNFIKVFVIGNIITMIYAFAFAGYTTAVTNSAYAILENGERGQFNFTYTGLAAHIMHIGYLSTYVGIALLMALYTLIFNKAKPIIWVPISMFLGFSLLMLQGRINVLAFITVIGVVILAYAIKKKAYKWLLLPLAPMVLFVAFILLGPQSLTGRFLQVPDFDYDISAPAESFNSATYRLAEWTGAMKVIAENPLTGTGVGDNRKALIKAYVDIGFNVGVDRTFNAHNQYLETAMAGGLIGLLLLLIMLIGYARIAYQRFDFLTTILILFFALCMLTESMFERAWAVILFTVLFPVLLLAGREPQRTRHKKS